MYILLVHDKAHELVRALRQSPEYKSLIVAGERLKGDPAALKMFIDYRKKEVELQARLMGGEEESNSELEALAKRREIVFLNSLVREYAACEVRFGAVFGDVQRIIGDALQEIGAIYEEAEPEEGGQL